MKPDPDGNHVSTIWSDDRGQATIEYLLLILIAVIPAAMMVPVCLRLILLYFYRIANTVASPFS